MNAITGMSAILKRNEHLPEQEVYLEGVSQNAIHLLHIINDILDLSKIDAGKLELESLTFSIEKIINEVIQETKEKAEFKKLELIARVSDSVPDALIGDELRIKQIISNLTRNAIKFTDEGSVEINVTAKETSGSKTSLTITVQDTGSGIPADRVETIFDEFNKAYSEGSVKYGGSGLGLSLGKRLIELMEGTIEVESEEGVGTLFTISIPFDTPTVSIHTLKEEEGEVELKDLKILLTDDNEFNLMVAQDELIDAIPGVEIDVATNGKEAIDKVAFSEYDLILMDIQMPEMSGYDATKFIRSMDEPKRSTPVLAMTANGVESEVRRCMEAGMDGFVPKPFKRVELTSAIKKVLKRSDS
jgi:CheY-like chemotaxis protein